MNDDNKSEPATKADLQELATKADLQNLAQATKADLQELAQTTKADLQELAHTTKADLQNLAQATKADLQELAQTTKADLAAVDMKLSIAIAKTQAELRNIRETMSTKEDINRIMNHIDAFAAEALSYRNHDTIRGGKIMEHETKLSNHETRISELEINPR